MNSAYKASFWSLNPSIHDDSWSHKRPVSYRHIRQDHAEGKKREEIYQAVLMWTRGGKECTHGCIFLAEAVVFRCHFLQATSKQVMGDQHTFILGRCFSLPGFLCQVFFGVVYSMLVSVSLVNEHRLIDFLCL